MCFADMPSELDGNLGLFDLHLFAVDGSFHCILAAKVPARRGTAFSWSPQSDEIAYTSCAGEAGELIVVSRDGTRRMSPSAGGTCLGNRQGYPPLWSPDGSTIYCTTGGSVYAVSRATGEVRDVTGGLGRYVFGIVHSLESGTVSEFGVPGTVAVMARDGDTLQEGIFRIGAGKPEVIVAESNRSLVSFLLYGDAQGDWIVGQAEDPASPPDLLGVNVTSGEQRRLTRLNPHIDIAPQGCRRLISYHGPRGEHLRASLMLPPKPRAREDLSNDHPALLWTGAVTVQELV
jgi:dipeptidyl aminopeptidase/acylaminoacyl peptidase